MGVTDGSENGESGLHDPAMINKAKLVLFFDEVMTEVPYAYDDCGY
jgi:hypothetical protein